MKALILAAGKGTRLGHLTENCPKPMLPIGDKPLIERLIGWLRQYGCRDIAINLHHHGDQIRAYFGNGQRLGVDITYSVEPTLLGTAGSAKALQSFLNETFVIVYGDVFTDLNLTRLLAFHQTARRWCGENGSSETGRCAITMALYSVHDPTRCGIVALDDQGRIDRFIEKPSPGQVFSNLANAGVLICEPGCLDLLPADTFYDFGHDVVPLYLERRLPLFGQRIADDEFCIDIGTPDTYREAQSLVSRQP